MVIVKNFYKLQVRSNRLNKKEELEISSIVICQDMIKQISARFIIAVILFSLLLCGCNPELSGDGKSNRIDIGANIDNLEENKLSQLIYLNIV